MLYSIKRIYKKNTSENQVEKPGFFGVHFIAKKKVFKRAVQRNRVKRRARHAFNEALKWVLLTPPPHFKTLTQIIFFLEHDMIQESYSTIVDSFKKDLLKN